MSCNNEGKAEFCPGCPNRGDFVGGLALENVSVVAPEFIAPNTQGVAISFTDEEGFSSDRIKVYDKDIDNKKYGHHKEHMSADEIKQIGLAATCELVERICKCNGPRGERPEDVDARGGTECPAFNDEVVVTLMTKSYHKNVT